EDFRHGRDDITDDVDERLEDRTERSEDSSAAIHISEQLSEGILQIIDSGLHGSPEGQSDLLDVVPDNAPEVHLRDQEDESPDDQSNRPADQGNDAREPSSLRPEG